MEQTATRSQRDVCKRAGVRPDSPRLGSKAGIGPLVGYPLNGLRHPSTADASGWFIWAGGEIDQSDAAFFRPVHLEHVAEMPPEIVDYLALPPGWRFQTAPGHDDIWFDPDLLISE
jgi:hypothetical protein